MISAWDVRPELELFFDRLFCRRIGGPVPLTLKEYPPDIKEVLSIKVRKLLCIMLRCTRYIRKNVYHVAGEGKTAVATVCSIQ